MCGRKPLRKAGKSWLDAFRAIECPILSAVLIALPSLPNNLALLASAESEGGRWHQQDHDVEEVRAPEGTSQMRKRSLYGTPVPTAKWGFCSP
jgi:hypothetical protein